MVKDGIFLEDLFGGRDCYITRTLAANTLSDLDSDGSNPPITVTSNMVLTGDLSADTVHTAGTLHVGGGITCSNPTSSSIVATKNLTLGQTGDQYGATHLHLRNRQSENGAIFESTNATTALLDLIARMGNGVQRNIRLEGRPEFSTLEAPAWHIGGVATPGGLGELMVADTRCAVRNQLTIRTTATYTSPLVVEGPIVGASFHTLSDASLKDDVLEVAESDCVAMLEAVTSKTYMRNDLGEENRRIGFIAQEVAAHAPPTFQNVWTTTKRDGTELLMVDYGRLTAILWGVCRNLHARVAAHEAGS